jgi:hypothetical protein
VVGITSEPSMDMWISVLRLSEHEFAISALVNIKTITGEMYMAIIKPFHNVVAIYAIKQVLKAGRI